MSNQPGSTSRNPDVYSVFLDDDDNNEWTEPWTRGAGILHIELRRWQIPGKDEHRYS